MLERIKLFLNKFDSQPEHPAPVDFATALGALMVEVMRADNDIASDELKMITKLLQQHCQLSADSSDLICSKAQRLVNEAIDLHRFVKVVNDNTSEEARIEVIELLWMVAFADGKLDPQEDYTVRKLAGLMYVAHGDFIAAKLNVKNVLGLPD